MARAAPSGSLRDCIGTDAKQRRNPFLVFFLPALCDAPQHHDRCTRAHNDLEISFHPLLYKSTPCLLMDKCASGPKLCANFHHPLECVRAALEVEAPWRRAWRMRLKREQSSFKINLRNSVFTQFLAQLQASLAQLRMKRKKAKKKKSSNDSCYSNNSSINNQDDIEKLATESDAFFKSLLLNISLLKEKGYSKEKSAIALRSFNNNLEKAFSQLEHSESKTAPKPDLMEPIGEREKKVLRLFSEKSILDRVKTELDFLYFISCNPLINTDSDLIPVHFVITNSYIHPKDKNLYNLFSLNDSFIEDNWLKSTYENILKPFKEDLRINLVLNIKLEEFYEKVYFSYNKNFHLTKEKISFLKVMSAISERDTQIFSLKKTCYDELLKNALSDLLAKNLESGLYIACIFYDFKLALKKLFLLDYDILLKNNYNMHLKNVLFLYNFCMERGRNKLSNFLFKKLMHYDIKNEFFEKVLLKKNYIKLNLNFNFLESLIPKKFYEILNLNPYYLNILYAFAICTSPLIYTFPILLGINVNDLNDPEIYFIGSSTLSSNYSNTKSFISNNNNNNNNSNNNNGNMKSFFIENSNELLKMNYNNKNLSIYLRDLLDKHFFIFSTKTINCNFIKNFSKLIKNFSKKNKKYFITFCLGIHEEFNYLPLFVILCLLNNHKLLQILLCVLEKDLSNIRHILTNKKNGLKINEKYIDILKCCKTEHIDLSNNDLIYQNENIFEKDLKDTYNSISNTAKSIYNSNINAINSNNEFDNNLEDNDKTCFYFLNQHLDKNYNFFNLNLSYLPYLNNLQFANCMELAILHNNYEMVKILLHYNFLLNKENYKVYITLCKAGLFYKRFKKAFEEHLKIFKTLKLHCEEKRQVLQKILQQSDYVTLVYLLLNKFYQNKDLKEFFENFPIHNFIMQNYSQFMNIDQESIIIFSLLNGAQKDIFNKSYQTPLMVAVNNQNLKIAKLLLKFKSNFFIRFNSTNDTVLHCACNNNDFEMVYLIMNSLKSFLMEKINLNEKEFSFSDNKIHYLKEIVEFPVLINNYKRVAANLTKNQAIKKIIEEDTAVLKSMLKAFLKQ